MTYVKGFTVQGPKRKKSKTEKAASSFTNPKKSYYKLKTPKSWISKLKKKQKKNKLA